MPKALLKDIPIERLSRGKYQPRREFDEIGLQELSESIKVQGLLQPIVVRPGRKEGHYEIVAGERRWRASMLAQLSEVPCLIRNLTDEQAAAATTIENIQRQDLNPMEEAQGYQQFIDDFGYLHEEIAAMVGVSRTKITNTLRLLKLCTKVQQFIIERMLSEGHGRCLAGLNEGQQVQLAQKVIGEGWSVRQLERVVKQMQNAPKSQKLIHAGQDIDVGKLTRDISEKMGTEIKFDQELAGPSGWLKIRYYDPDTLAGLLDKMGVEYEKE